MMKHLAEHFLVNDLVEKKKYRHRLKSLEPLPPIYIRAPQPTVILRSDLQRLRAELNSRVRPPGR